MCRFCKNEEGATYIANPVAQESPVISVNDKEVFNISILMISDDYERNPRIEAGLYLNEGGEEIAIASVPIRYCPHCGRKLR